MRVIGARCVIKVEKITKENPLGIIRVNKQQEESYTGVVVAVGDGAMLPNGEKVPMVVAVEDKVIFTPFSGSPVVVDGEEFVIINERDILCIL